MSRLFLYLYLFLTLIAFAGSSAIAGDNPAKPVNLHPKWNAGQSSIYKIDATSNQSQTVNIEGHSKTQTTVIKVKSKVIWKVDKKNKDGSYDCTLSRKWMSATLIGPKGEKKKNDTRSGEDDIKPLYQTLKALVDYPLHIHVSADGSADRVTGLDDIKQQVEIKEFIPQPKEVEHFVNTLAPIASSPSKAKIGDSWQAQFIDPLKLGTVTNNVKYKLKNVGKIANIKTASITGTGNLSFNFDDSKLPKGAPPMDVRFKNGSYKEQIIYDFSRHEAAGRNIISSQTLEMDIHLPKNHTIHQQLKRNSTRTILRVAIDKDS